jgi:hypothetical protein
MAQGVWPEFKPQYHIKKKKKGNFSAWELSWLKFILKTKNFQKQKIFMTDRAEFLAIKAQSIFNNWLRWALTKFKTFVLQKTVLKEENGKPKTGKRNCK